MMNQNSKARPHFRFLAGIPAILLLFWGMEVVSCGGGSSSGTSTAPSNNPPPSSQGSDVLTYHDDNARTGQNLKETTLTTSNVNPTNFGLLFTIPADGKVDAEPLYAANVTVNQAAHNVLFVETEHGTAYAVDADSGSVLWQISTLQSGETPSDNHGCSQISPEIGITDTPVIDRNAGSHGIIYMVAMSKDGAGKYHQRLHALDLTTGAEELGGPKEVQATYSGTGDNSSGGMVVFDPAKYAERAGLLLLNGAIYTAWTSHCDGRPYTGWVMSYDQATLAQKSVLNLTPNGNEGAVWMSGAGLAADSSGNIFLLDANGQFDTTLDANGFPSQGDYGNAFVKLSTTNNQLAVADYFEMFNQAAENGSDRDLGSGGALLLPDLADNSGKTWHLAAGAGKDGNLYVVDRDNMGKFNASSNNIYQELDGALPGGIWAMPAYFNNVVYYGPVGSPLRAFSISNAKLSTSPTSQSPSSFQYPGCIPSVSANGTNSGIVWAAENSSPAVLHAYDAGDLSHELYNSNQAANGRDHFGSGNKFITPMIAGGKVYVGTTNGVGVFGLLH